MLRFFEDRFGRDALEQLVASLGLDITELEDPDTWISSVTARDLGNALISWSEEPLITYEAGMAMASPTMLGPTYYLTRALGSPRLVYSKLADLNRQMSKITHWETLFVSDHKATLRFLVVPGQIDDPLFCLNRQGVLAGVPTLFDLPAARVEHPICIHQGGPYCEYHITWTKPSLISRWMGTLVIVLALITSVLGFTGHFSPPVMAGALVVAAGLALFHIRDLHNKLRAITETGQTQLVKNMSQVLEESQRRHKELTLLDKVDRLTRRQLEVDTLLETSLTEITTTLGYDRALFMIVDDKRHRLVYAHCTGFPPALVKLLESYTIDLEPTGYDEGLFATVVKQRQSLLVSHIDDFQSRLTKQSRTLLEQLRSHALVAIPINADDQDLGLLMVDQASPERSMTQRDLRLLEQLGHTLGLALSNAKLVESLRRRRRELEQALLLNQKFSLYLPSPAVEQIRQDPATALEMVGRRIRAAVLFSDVVGFTPWTEAHDPEVVVEALNRYFAAMDEVIERNHGILDKRMGDGMMVVFLAASPATGRPLPTHPARRALLCAMQMQEAIDGINASSGIPGIDLKVRIGVSYGELVAGNIGSHHRLEYTVIGDVVNVASRLESACTPGSVFTTAETYRAARGGFEVASRGKLKVKGRRKPVPTYEVLRVVEDPKSARARAPAA